MDEHEGGEARSTPDAPGGGCGEPHPPAGSADGTGGGEPREDGTGGEPGTDETGRGQDTGETGRGQGTDGTGGGPRADAVYVGRAARDAALDRGWLLGHFKEPGDPRHSQDVEIKWGVHPRGEERARWVRGEQRTTLLVLVSGRFRVRLPGREVLLAEQGDYVVWGRGTDHSWRAEEDAVVLTVRWPSVPGYAVPPAVAAGAAGVATGEGAPPR